MCSWPPPGRVGSGRTRRQRELWGALGPVLGMEHPAAATGLPDVLPGKLEDLPAGGTLAARRSRDGLHQAVLRRRHDLLCLSVALSPSVGDRGARAAWERRWTEAAGPTHEWAVGDARLFVAYRRFTDDGAAEEHETEDVIRSELPPDESPMRLGPGGDISTPRPHRVGSGGRVRSTAIAALRRGDGRPRRPTAGGRALAVESGGSAPPAFARYLADAARLRYEIRVHAAHDSDTPGDSTGIVDDALAALDRRPSRSGTLPESWSLELTRWRHRLLSLIASSDGLTQRITRLREMRTTVRIARPTCAP
ncbi:CATRA conflict system CASPASE/TPR repeat-associated protein [Streptomyces sp. NPDC088810]|uniref:CATRA conflict system CASPASE/TPR repeat-associated protein n=1 Tax=Streptomyces sp. NPDC088810 TaxID=3365904 RepID=UPI00381BC884